MAGTATPGDLMSSWIIPLEIQAHTGCGCQHSDLDLIAGEPDGQGIL